MTRWKKLLLYVTALLVFCVLCFSAGVMYRVFMAQVQVVRKEEPGISAQKAAAVKARTAAVADLNPKLITYLSRKAETIAWAPARRTTFNETLANEADEQRVTRLFILLRVQIKENIEAKIGAPPEPGKDAEWLVQFKKEKAPYAVLLKLDKLYEELGELQAEPWLNELREEINGLIQKDGAP
jgi:hypothetical protein